MSLFLNTPDFPKYLLEHKHLIKGISIYACVDGSALPNEQIAHAHCLFNDPFKGWICIRTKSHLKHRLLLLHEVAHLIANDEPKIPFHGKKWKEALTSIGGTFKSYQYKINQKTLIYPDYTYKYK